LDVRDQKSYRAGHVKGSTLIPGGELQQRMHELRTDRMIVVLAEGDAKAVRAVRMLRNAALDAVHLKGGVGQWPGKMVK
jgi:rhodanese-related sulfurtransferase